MPNRFVKFESTEEAEANLYKAMGDAWYQGITQGAGTTIELDGQLGLVKVGTDGRFYPTLAGPPFTYDGVNTLAEPLWSQTLRGEREITDTWPQEE